MKELLSVTVTGNWRIVFRYHEPTNTVSDIGLIDYTERSCPATMKTRPIRATSSNEIIDAGLSVSKAATFSKVRRAA
jgi:hypothetical protein